MIKQPLLPRFFSKVDKTSSSNGCWLWMSFFLKDGYGGFWFRNRAMAAHRASWILNVGEIPDGLWVLHKCDNPRCVNPAHLFLGTALDNNQDMVRKGRQNPPKGERSAATKLKEWQVIEIRKLHTEGVTQRKIAVMFDVGFKAINKIVLRKRWAHVA